jgi:hypothetical protein
MNVLRKILLKIAVTTFLLNTTAAFSQDKIIELSESDVKDVVELLKFVNSAKPELFKRFAGSFEEVGASCSQNIYKEEYAQEVSEIIMEIERDLPETNKSLMTTIKFAVFMGGKGIYKPEFIDQEHVRDNILKFMGAVREAYLGKDFDECSRLVNLGLDTSATTKLALR